MTAASRIRICAIPNAGDTRLLKIAGCSVNTSGLADVDPEGCQTRQMADDTIRVDELRAAMERILVAVERTQGDLITLDEDYYWHLPVEDAYQMRDAPQITEVGQVSDDVAEIRQSLANGEEVFSVWHDLSHLIGVLRVVEKMSLL